MTFKNITLSDRPQGVRLLQVNRPSALNALNTETLLELKQALQMTQEHAGTRVLILSGEGDRSFVAGADIAEMEKMSPGEAVQFSHLGHEVTKLLDLMPKPVLAAVNGYALGGGTELAIACDFIYASEKAVFGLPEVSLGVIPGFGATIRLAKFIGLPKAKELIFSGRKISATEALSYGLVNQILPHPTLLSQVIELAQKISSNSYSAVSYSKQLLNEFSETNGLNFKLDAESQAFGRLFGTFDQKEGMSAFVNKRKAVFEGTKTQE